MKTLMTVSLLLGTLTFAGCSSMSGLAGESEFGCKAPPGVTCQSISGVHANAMEENLPFQRKGGVPAQESDKTGIARYGNEAGSQKISPKEMVVPMSGMPIRKPPLILRVWVAPYEDEARDLHDQSFFYTMVNSGEWMIEANRNNLRNQFKPILAPVGGVDKKEDDADSKRQPVRTPSPYGQTPNLPN